MEGSGDKCADDFDSSLIYPLMNRKDGHVFVSLLENLFVTYLRIDSMTKDLTLYCFCMEVFCPKFLLSFPIAFFININIFDHSLS